MCTKGGSYQRCCLGAVVCVGLCIWDSGCACSLGVGPSVDWRVCVAVTMAFRSSQEKLDREASGIRENNDGTKGTRETRHN